MDTTMGKKRVHWSTITIHEFGVGHGGSAVPKSGPSIGLAREPEFTWSTDVGTMARECDGVRRFSSAERVALLRSAGFSSDKIDAFVSEAKAVRASRELYYSSEMKSFRKKRKQTKAEARATRQKLADTPVTPVKTTHVIATAAIATASTVADHQEEEEKPRLRIEIVATTESKLASLSPLLPHPLPLSPCCS